MYRLATIGINTIGIKKRYLRSYLIIYSYSPALERRRKNYVNNSVLKYKTFHCVLYFSYIHTQREALPKIKRNEFKSCADKYSFSPFGDIKR